MQNTISKQKKCRPNNKENLGILHTHCSITLYTFPADPHSSHTPSMPPSPAASIPLAQTPQSFTPTSSLSLPFAPTLMSPAPIIPMTSVPSTPIKFATKSQSFHFCVPTPGRFSPMSSSQILHHKFCVPAK